MKAACKGHDQFGLGTEQTDNEWGDTEQDEGMQME